MTFTTQSLRTFLSTLALVALLSWPPVSRADADPELGKQVRSFLQELIAAGSSAQESRASSMRQVFVKHPEAFRWFAEETPEKLLSSAGLQELRIPISGDKQILQEIQELAKNEIQDWIRSAGLREEIASTASSLLPDVTAESATSRLAKQETKRFSKAFAELPMESRQQVLQVVHEGRFEEIAKKLDTVLLEAGFSDSEAIQQLTRSGALKYDQIPIPPEEISKFIERYFDALDLPARRSIMLGLLELPPGASAERQLSVFIQRSGPALQKFFQLAGRGAQSPVLKKVLKELHANVAPFPFGDARAALEKSLGGTIDTLFRSFDTQPLAAGTIGQVHRAVSKNGEDVVVKVRRPGITEQIAREMEIARKISADTPVSGMIDKLHVSLLRELDFRLEGKSLDKAVQVYSNQKKGIEIPARVTEFPLSEDTLVVRLAKGQHPTDMKTLLVRRGEALSGLLEQWIDVAIFKDGFFNSDLHPGNLFLERVTDSDPPLRVHPIDFGNSGQLTLAERRTFVRLSLGAFSKSPYRMLEALGPLAPKITEAQKIAILNAMNEIDLSNMKPATTVERFLSIVLAHGVELQPADLLNFQRGKTLLEGQLADINARLNKFDPKKKLKRYDPENIYVRLTVRRLRVDVPKQLISSKARANTVAPLSDLTRMLLRQSHLVDAYFMAADSCTLRAFLQLF